MNRIVCLGSGSAWDEHNSSFVIEGEFGNLLIDCGHTVPRQYERAIRKKIIQDKPLSILITHLHGDHIFGLEEMGFRFKYDPLFLNQDKLDIYYPNASCIWNIFSQTMGGSEGGVDFFNFKEGAEFDIQEFKVSFVETPHVDVFLSYGLSINIKSSGINVWYSGDTSTPNLEMIASHDVVLHELTLLDSVPVHCYFKKLPIDKEIITYHYAGDCPTHGKLTKAENFGSYPI